MKPDRPYSLFKKSSFLILSVTAAIALMAFALGNNIKDKTFKKVDFIESDAIAVIELFTSEGCSSCPPADALLQRIDNRNLENVYPLSFHVDYWNRLGWTDPYSKEVFSERQRWYASQFSSSRVYTPQMIVNGTTEFVGSNASKAESAINNALKSKSLYAVSASKIVANDDEIKFSFKIDGANASGKILRVALIQKQTQQNVKAGENRNKNLRHINVVREFLSYKITTSNGNLSINKPSQLSISELELVLYIQNADNTKIVAATALQL